MKIANSRCLGMVIGHGSKLGFFTTGGGVAQWWFFEEMLNSDAFSIYILCWAFLMLAQSINNVGGLNFVYFVSYSVMFEDKLFRVLYVQFNHSNLCF
eukprot:c1860_g1_i1 orf=17-307(-)